MKAPNCVFCLASLHLISMLSPVLLNSPLRAFFLFSPCQLLLFDLQKQMRNPGESPRPSGMTEFSSAPPTPCHSPRVSLSSPSRAAPPCIAGPGDTRALLPSAHLGIVPSHLGSLSTHLSVCGLLCAVPCHNHLLWVNLFPKATWIFPEDSGEQLQNLTSKSV